MRLILIGTLALSTVIAGVVVAPVAASADETSVHVDEAERHTVAGVVTTTGAGSGGQGRRERCSWQSVDESGAAGADGTLSAMTATVRGEVAFLYRRSCPDGSSDHVWVVPRNASDLIPSLRDEVRRRLPAPVPLFRPYDEDRGWAWVRVPIDVRVDAALLDPIVATAAIAGPPGFDPWVTITAQPVALHVTPPVTSGTDPIVCSVADAAAPYLWDDVGRCSVVFVNASSVESTGAFDVATSIEWQVTYESSDGPGTLSLAPTASTTALAVAEIQALVNCVGPGRWRGACD